MLFKIVKAIVNGFMHIIFRVHVHGTENLPKEGACLVAINHKSFWDAPLLVGALPRKMAFMAKKELFAVPIVGPVIKWAGAFPVNRGTGDIGAIKASLRALQAGQALAIFPEGRRVFKNEPHSAKAGVALIAERTKAPIVPVAIRGGYRLFSKIDIFIEKSIRIQSENGEKLSMEELQKASDALLHTILQIAEPNGYAVGGISGN